MITVADPEAMVADRKEMVQGDTKAAQETMAVNGNVTGKGQESCPGLSLLSLDKAKRPIYIYEQMIIYLLSI
ncbi:hypothetical protein DGMP_21270 [Desulfomarina profundi]|uniref:Uncharacterized protein n=1 Tax=Desulfomarina profundi TaxID=2772557 RepID=A0A8D5FTJ2_9BACT|nr:hypothetical protein DGMP_21270 [Desulfomarina profundi]